MGSINSGDHIGVISFNIENVTAENGIDMGEFIIINSESEGNFIAINSINLNGMTIIGDI